MSFYRVNQTNLSSPLDRQRKVLFTVLCTNVFAVLQDLKDYMRQAGEVTFTQCHRDRIGEGLASFVIMYLKALVQEH